MKLIKFPEIEQFRHIVKHIRDSSAYVGKDEKGDTVFDYLRPQPVLTAKGTVKLHGTNAGVSMDIDTKEAWAQSRENILFIEKDNAGFAAFVNAKKVQFMNLFLDLEVNYKIKDAIVTVYGEWCGKGIQKGVAVSEVPKMFVIFGVKISPKDESTAYWVDHKGLKSVEHQIFNISDFETFELEIDFNKPEYAQDAMSNITLKVEEQCPVGKAFGVEGIGEGVVWEITYNDSRVLWKVKGEKHSNSKVKTLKPVDLEKLSIVDRCVEEITHDWRFEQGLRFIFGADYQNTLDRTKLGEYLKWVSQDTIKEEYDIIEKYALDIKDVMPKVQKMAKDFFFNTEKL